jgi:hypothetical protein
MRALGPECWVRWMDVDAQRWSGKGSPVRRRVASASNCESVVRGAGNGKPPDGWSEGSAGW